MPRKPTVARTEFEELVARVTAAAYEVALRHGVRGSFVDVELALWRRVRAVLQQELGRQTSREEAAGEVVACRP
jgi:hypothetical protein